MKYTFYTKNIFNWWNKTERNVTFDYLINNKIKFHVDSKIKKYILNFIIWFMKKVDFRMDIICSEPKETIYKENVINDENIIELIRKYKINVEYIWREKPKYLIVGQDEYYKLTKEYAHSIQHTNCELKFYVDKNVYDGMNHSHNERETSFWGFKLVVIPWISGCFILPEL